MAERLETVDAIVEKYAVVSSPVKSKIYVGLGSIFVVFSIIGIWIPLKLILRQQNWFCLDTIIHE